MLTIRFVVYSDSSIRLLDIDDVVREAWKEAKLDDVEEILSKHLIRCTGSDHSLFANRALIRARLRRWDAALRDAETVSLVFFLSLSSYNAFNVTPLHT